MKRVAAALVLLGVGTALGAPAGAATLGGSAHLTWTVGAVTSVSLVTDYSATTVQGTTNPATFQASGTGTCGAGGVAETANTLTFGTITPPAAGYQGCNYQNAVAIGVQSNDSLGYKIYEYMNSPIPAGTTVCALANDASMATNATMSSRGVPAAATSPTACAGTALAAMAGAASGSGYGAPGTAAGNGTANATPTYVAYTSGGYNFISATSASPSVQWAGQDVQLNISSAAASGAVSTSEIIFTVVPN